MNTVYVTIVSYEYALMGLSIGRALIDNNKQCAIYCMDDRAADLLEAVNMKGCMVFRPVDYMDDTLKRVRKERSDSEFCWTCKPIILEHILANVSDLDWAVYLDSDTMIYGDPDLGLPPDERCNVMLTPHNPSNHYFESFIDNAGIYNAGYIAFRNSGESRRALQWWLNKCVGCCTSKADGDVYADQRYLNKMPGLFEGVYVCEHPGVNAGPWNILGKNIYRKDNQVFINDRPLLIYHMQGFKKLSARIFDLYCGEQRLPKDVRETIYLPYLCHLASISESLPKTYLSNRAATFNSRVRLFLREIKRLARGVSNVCFYRFKRC